MSMSPSSLISEFDHSMPVRARRFVVSAGALRIADQGADQPKQPILFGMSWSAKKRADFDIGHLTAGTGRVSRCVLLTWSASCGLGGTV